MTGEVLLEPDRIVAARYRVIRRIGVGGIGSVYHVRHVHTDEELALKVLQSHALAHADAVDRFRKEARVTARIGSEHVTRVIDADTAPDLDNAPFLVMELLRGNDLTALVRERGPLQPPLVVEILQQIGRALDKAHALGIVHRDLKPDNLFLTQRDDGSACIKILDFGIARVGDAMAGDRKTQAGLVFGTPGYMAPEQMTGEPDRIGPASDVWALGLVAYFLLTGHDYWEASNLTQLYAAVLTGPIVAPSARGSTLGPGFDAWFLKAVAREPEERFQAAGSAGAALATALGMRASMPPVAIVPPEFALGATMEQPMLPALAALPPLGSASGVAQAVTGAPSTAYGATMVQPSTPPPPPGPGRMPSAPALPPLDRIAAPTPRTGAPVGLILGAAAAVGLGIVGLGAYLGLRDTSTSAAVHALADTPSVPSGTPAGPAEAGATPGVTPSAPSTPSGSPRVIPPAGTAPMVDTQARPADVNDVPTTAAVVPREPVAVRIPQAGLTPEKKARLVSLQNLCKQGTFTPAECAAKNAAILRGDP